MTVWGELLVVGLLWGAVVVGLVCVVCDCMKEWRRETTSSNLDSDAYRPCCGVDVLKQPACRREES